MSSEANPLFAARSDRQRHPVRRVRDGIVRFLIDRCAGRRLADWLRGRGHDVVESRDLGADTGDRALFERAAAERRIPVYVLRQG